MYGLYVASTITIKQYIDYLSQFPPETIIYMEEPFDGNGSSTFSSMNETDLKSIVLKDKKLYIPFKDS